MKPRTGVILAADALQATDNCTGDFFAIIFGIKEQPFPHHLFKKPCALQDLGL